MDKKTVTKQSFVGSHELSYTDGVYVAIDTSANDLAIYYSYDALNWIECGVSSVPDGYYPSGIAYGNGVFVISLAVLGSGTTAVDTILVASNNMPDIYDALYVLFQTVNSITSA